MSNIEVDGYLVIDVDDIPSGVKLANEKRIKHIGLNSKIKNDATSTLRLWQISMNLTDSAATC